MKKFGFIATVVGMIIIILGVLLTMALITAQKIGEHSRQASYSDNFQKIQEQFDKIHQTIKQPVGQITKNWCTACAFNDTQTGESQAGALTVNNETWKSLWFAGSPKDFFGNDFTLDENEQEFGSGDCRADVVISAGQDGIFYTKDDVDYQVSDPSCGK